MEAYLAKYNARFLCCELQTDVREGNPGLLTLIVEFESLAAAKQAYESAEYQEMIKLREPHSQISLTILEEGDHAVHSIGRLHSWKVPEVVDRKLSEGRKLP